MAEIGASEWQISYLQREASTRFKMPRIQRTYAWEQKHLSAFIKDLITASNDKNVEHYFGAFCTLRKPDDVELIIDGQQRIATSHLFLKYAREKVEDPLLKNQIDKIITPNNLKITLGRRDDETFKKIMRGENDVDTTSLLYKAYMYFESCLKDKENKKPIDDLVHALLERFRLVKITFPNKKFGPTFHLVNNRGKELTESELIKSHIFMDLEGDKVDTEELKSKLDELDRKWAKMTEDILETFSKGKSIDRFIQHVLGIKLGSSKLNSLYDELLESDEFKASSECWLTDLFEWSERYMDLLNPPEEFAKSWKEGRLDAKTRLQRIKDLGAVSIYPILLAGHKQYLKNKPNDFYKLIDLCYRFHIRVITLGGFNVDNYTSFAQKTAHNIYKNKLSLDDVVDELCGFIKKNGMKMQFKIEEKLEYIKEVKIIRHCLLLIEEDRYGVEKIANKPTIEHILPKKYKDTDWDEYIDKYYDYEDIDNFIHNLGNMTLLSRGLNATAKRKLFNEKFETYNSHYGITRELDNQKTWTPEDIKKRCKEYVCTLKKVLKVKI